MVGRPRSAIADAAIVDAALEEFGACGYDGMCVDSVAARAGVSKATIYRRYASKLELVMASAAAVAEDRSPVPETGTLRGDLVARACGLRDLLETSGSVVLRLVADARLHPELDAAHRRFVAERRAGTAAIMRRAEARGELRAGVDAEMVSDLLAAPVFYRFLLYGEVVDDAYVERAVDALLASITP